MTGYQIYKNNQVIAEINSPDVFSYSMDVTEYSTEEYSISANYGNGRGGRSMGYLLKTQAPVLNAPTNLQAELNQNNCILTWDMNPGIGSWIGWSGAPYDAVGTQNPAEYILAVRFKAEDIYSMNGKYLSKIAFYTQQAEGNFHLMVWQGGSQQGAGTLIVEQSVNSLTAESWNVIDLEIPVQISNNHELWIGVKCSTQGGYTVGLDDDDYIFGKGAWLNEGGNWYQLPSLLGTPRNLCIKGFVSDDDSKSGSQAKLDTSIQIVPSLNQDLKTCPVIHHSNFNSRGLTGFQIYRNNALIATVNSSQRQYADLNLAVGTYTYKMKAVYSEGVSEMSNPVTISYTLGNNDVVNADADQMSIYPNPFNPSTNI
nr:hypothetical protein [Candidatus Cloacimonadota bacterium]